MGCQSLVTEQIIDPWLLCSLSLSIACSLSLPLSFAFSALPLPLVSLSFRSTVFILLQPPCFCGAVSVVNTMKTGRIHYLAAHSSQPFQFCPPPLLFQPWIQQWISCFIVPFFPPTHNASLPRIVLHFHFLFLFCSMHLSAFDWLMLTFLSACSPSYLLMSTPLHCFYVAAKTNG